MTSASSTNFTNKYTSDETQLRPHRDDTGFKPHVKTQLKIQQSCRSVTGQWSKLRSEHTFSLPPIF